MVGPSEPLGYQPRPPRRATGTNFALGVLCGMAVSGAGWGLAYEIGRADVTVAVLISLLIAKLGIAISTARSGRHSGFGPGLLTSFGVVLLIAGGLCFAAVQKI